MAHHYIVSFCLLFAPALLIAQQAAITSGGEATGSGGSVSYTIGQPVYRTHTTASGSTAEGLQLPYEILTVGADQIGHIMLSFHAYPVPTADVLTLSIDGEVFDLSAIHFTLYDVGGRMMTSGQASGHTTQIAMDGFKPGIYFLRILETNNPVKVFKIIKR